MATPIFDSSNVESLTVEKFVARFRVEAFAIAVLYARGSRACSFRQRPSRETPAAVTSAAPRATPLAPLTVPAAMCSSITRSISFLADLLESMFFCNLRHLMTNIIIGRTRGQCCPLRPCDCAKALMRRKVLPLYSISHKHRIYCLYGTLAIAVEALIGAPSFFILRVRQGRRLWHRTTSDQGGRNRLLAALSPADHFLWLEASVVRITIGFTRGG